MDRCCNEVTALLLFIWRHMFIQENLSDQLIEYKSNKAEMMQA